jgi:hypothetical protein
MKKQTDTEKEPHQSGRPAQPAVNPDDYAGDTEDDAAAREQSNAYINDLEQNEGDQKSDISDREAG